MLFAVSLVVFIGTDILPGDIAQIILGQSATPENLAALRTALGLDDSATVRYMHWVVALASGDLGVSMARNISVIDLIGDRLGNTMTLAAWVAAITVPISVLAGLISAMYPGSRRDQGISWLTIGSISFPEFFTATVLILIFSIKLRLLPSISMLRSDDNIPEKIAALVLPVATLCISLFGQIVRLSRAATLNIMSEPYIEMAILKGLSRARIVLLHAAINAVGPIVNIVALNLAYLVGGVVIVETIFAYPGLAKLMVDSVQSRDLPVVQACAMIFCSTYVVLILIADLAAIVSNPRLRHPR